MHRTCTRGGHGDGIAILPMIQIIHDTSTKTRLVLVWSVVPHCVLWLIWRERNQRTFEGNVGSSVAMKLVLLRTLFEWSFVSNSHCFSS
jgi:hypothetical protein